MNNPLFKSIFALTFIGAIAAGLITYTHSLTDKIIAVNNANSIRSAYQQVLSQVAYLETMPVPEDSIITDIKANPVNHVITGYIYTVAPVGYGGKILLMVGINHPDSTINGVKIISQQETPGLGSKCTEPDFLSQFAGKSVRNPLLVTKNKATLPDEISAITASTITSRAVVQGVNVARNHYLKHYANK